LERAKPLAHTTLRTPDRAARTLLRNQRIHTHSAQATDAFRAGPALAQHGQAVAAGAVDLDLGLLVAEGGRRVGRQALRVHVEVVPATGLGGFDGGFDRGEGREVGRVRRWGGQGVVQRRGGVGLELGAGEGEGREGGAV
ncbi:hypothetical protein LTR16_005475, partial [Cryomyces antarcticus]